ncbi:MAG: hypothetical protein Q8P18_29660 [Pseudomonadota bacterium]|nr:hypothetical protein [Pseudomonadota bacterium]
MNVNTNNPRWWGDAHTSGWERVKEAMHRDWEQTKADFSGGKSGKELRQDAGDTVGQALGNQRIPAGDRPNPPDPGDVREAARKQDQLVEQFNARTERDVAPISRRLDAARWEDAQHPMRFGHGAGSHYSDNWDDAFEPRLRKDWEESYPGQRWEDARELARVGWNQARLTT